MKSKKSLLAFVISASMIFASLTIASSIALYQKSSKGNGSYGEISLRSYFERGTGTIDDPYVITRPRHMYNLSRLQGLGVFSTKKYFQLGFKPGEKGVLPMCYLGESNDLVPYLDMSNTYSNFSKNPINAIGSELLPFYGDFNGQNVEIKGLNVYASPEDAGLFGYTAHASNVHNLFLSDVMINALGYTSAYEGLYSSNTLVNNVSFTYNPNKDNTLPTTFNASTSENIISNFYCKSLDDFSYDANNSDGDPLPTISMNHPNNDGYTYSTLLSGNLIKYDTNGNITPDTASIFKLFSEKRSEGNYPMQASSIVSIIAAETDNYGIKHSKVLLTLEFDFTLDSADSNFIRMNVILGNEHSNNIGLIIGHCDGSIKDCYVYNGGFKMNNGDSITLSPTGTYGKLGNGSNLGLIGIVGNTVSNNVAGESDAASKAGKSVGVLDFTTIYKEIISSSSFTNSGDGENGVNFDPISTSKYISELRNDVYGNYRTLKKDTISFRGQRVISNTDLGVFTFVTDYATTGMGSEANYNLEKSLVQTEDLLVNNNYYLYYTTGEYQASSGIPFSYYRDSLNDNGASFLLPAYHFPDKDQVSDSSYDYRDLYHNYNIRFTLDPVNRTNSGFYFSELDMENDASAYLARYFHHRLVDQSGQAIPMTTGRCGVMLRNYLGQEIRSFSASFATNDISHDANNKTYLYTYDDKDGNHCAANSINFTITTKEANVTIVAAANKVDGDAADDGAAIGVYRMDNSDFAINGNLNYFNQDFESPDYAFFIPDDNHLTYFDYQYDPDTKKGRIGNYINNTFSPWVKGREATIANESGQTEYADPGSKSRLFVHTFRLPEGRYCVQSATGPNSPGRKHSTAKIYYLCAQGQNDGQLDFADSIFVGDDVAENVDFIRQARFSQSGNPNIDVSSKPTRYDPTDSNIYNQRLYVAMVNSDRSTFAAKDSDIYFTYNPGDGKFYVTTTKDMSGMSHVALNNYNHSLAEGDNKTLVISLFGKESIENTIAYTYEA